MRIKEKIKQQKHELVEDLALEKSENAQLQQDQSSVRPEVIADDNYAERRKFFNQVLQPALEGMMDGSLSSIAPIFITIFMTRHTLTTFFIGGGAALTSGISEVFSESLSDDEDLSERGKPFVHAGITGLFTFISGLMLALPFLIPNYRISLTLAYIMVFLEFTTISALRIKFLGIKWWLSALQIFGGGVIVFVAAFFLGNA